MTQGDQTRDSIRRSLRSRISLWRYVVEGSGGGFEGDSVAQSGELGDVVTHPAFDVDAAGVVFGSEVMEPGERVSEQVPDDDQDGTGDRDQGFEFATAFDDAPVTLAEEGLGARGRGGGLAERTLQIGVALTGATAAGDGPGLDGARAQLGPRHQVRGGGEAGHVQPDLGDDHLRVEFADAGDLVEALDGTQPRALGLDGRIDPTRCAAGRFGCAPSWLRPGVGSIIRAGCGDVGVLAATMVDRGGLGQLGDQVFDPAGEGVDLGAN